MAVNAAATSMGLVDQRTLFSYAYQMIDVDVLLGAPRRPLDLTEILRYNDGYAKLGPGDYTCNPAYLCSGDTIEGCGIRTRLWFTGRAIQPEASSRPTEYVQIRDLDLCCDDRGGTDQHAIWMPSCREWTIERVRAINFGGTAFYLYGQRTPAGDLDPSDTTRCVLRQTAAWGCRYGYVLSGTAGDPVIRGGTSNMNRLERTLSYWSELDAYALLQGAGNVIDQAIAGNSGGDGLRVGWYGNDVRMFVAERNAGYGVRKVRREWSDRTTVTLHSGGNNGLGDTNY